MARKDRPLQVEIPKPGGERPAWSRVGIIGAAGFVIGIVWPRLSGIDIGPDVPEDARPKASAEAAAPPVASAALPAPAPPPGASAAAAEAPAANQESVTVGPGTITRCWDAKGKKVDDCGELQFDPVALPKLRELARCPAALGLDGKLSIGIEVDFKKKEVQVTKGKKSSLPTSTTSGVLQCAARDLSHVELDDVPHQYKRYSLSYTATFSPPGKHPEEEETADGGAEGAAGSTTSESAATGQATVRWDTALLRKDPKDGDVVARIVRGTRVKIIGRQNDWYKVESGAKAGWVYRGAIGL